MMYQGICTLLLVEDKVTSEKKNSGAPFSSKTIDLRYFLAQYTTPPPPPTSTKDIAIMCCQVQAYNGKKIKRSTIFEEGLQEDHDMAIVYYEHFDEKYTEVRGKSIDIDMP